MDWDCCKAEDPTLVDWVENKVYQDEFPDIAVRAPRGPRVPRRQGRLTQGGGPPPQMQVERCKHDQRDGPRSDALCQECIEANIKVGAAPRPVACADARWAWA